MYQFLLFMYRRVGDVKSRVGGTPSEITGCRTMCLCRGVSELVGGVELVESKWSSFLGMVDGEGLAPTPLAEKVVSAGDP